MTGSIIDRIKQFQEYLFEIGLARAVLALPAPRMLSLPSPSAEGAGTINVYTQAVTENEIVSVSRDLFASGHYSLSVQESYKSVEKYIQDKIGSNKVSGTGLMELVFSPKTPKLYWSERETTSQLDEQIGYHRLYSGAMLGIRNPVTHEFNWVDDPEVALELIIFAQHLLRKAKSAQFDDG